MKFNNEYLVRKYKEYPSEIEAICRAWAIPEDKFAERVDDWFQNFARGDYELAFKILKEIDFYNSARIEKELYLIMNEIEKQLLPTKLDKEKILLIVPDGYGDSAHRHAYDLTKIWGIDNRQICPVNQLPIRNITNDTVLIAFNDTYGSGNQFVTDMVKGTMLRELAIKCWLFVVGLTISDTAREYLKYALPKADILPKASPKTIYDNFNYRETTRISEIGADIYPPHPLGYGRAGLLVVYEFQCPNNSIPLIWANSKTENNEFEGYAYPWNSLWEYKPKTKFDLNSPTAFRKDANYEPETHTIATNVVRKKFTAKTKLKFTEDELLTINNIVDNWEFSTKKHNTIIKDKLAKWFDNFEPRHKEMALKIFSNINYLSLSRTREEIKNLRDKVTSVVSRSGDKKNDIILVITGDEIESSYHYIYDFMRYWGLQLSQVLTLKHICKHPYEVVHKHLVFFYHTRIHRTETFFSDVWPRISGLPAKHIHVLSFMMSEVTTTMFDNLIKETECEDSPYSMKVSYYYCEAISKPLKAILSDNELTELRELLESKSVNERNIKNRFLTAYYFKCPKATLSLLWYGDKVNALF